MKNSTWETTTVAKLAQKGVVILWLAWVDSVAIVAELGEPAAVLDSNDVPVVLNQPFNKLRAEPASVDKDEARRGDSGVGRRTDHQ